MKMQENGRNSSYQIKKLQENELTEIYQSYMKRDFPSSELKPLSHILHSMEVGFGFTLGIYEEEETVGYAVFILCEETGCALLDYFAILEDRRGKGVGHNAFSLIVRYFEENLSEIAGLYIESERVLAAENEEQRKIRKRRIAFYLSCGCEMTALRAVLFGVDYSVLYKPFGKRAGKTNAADKPSKEALDALYRKMFQPAHYAESVSLTEMQTAGKTGILGGVDV